MFRKKQPNKVKLEHKLYLARENPEPVFDLSECDLPEVPTGIYSLCKVFLKESLRLENNNLSSLTGGGELKDLYLIKKLNLSYNLFHRIPTDIELLINLQELYLSNNQIKKINDNICNLKSLKILDISNNHIKELPDNIGNLINLKKFIINNNKLKILPKSFYKLKKLCILEFDVDSFIYPPPDVNKEGLEAIMRFICEDIGVEFNPQDVDLDVDNLDTLSEDFTDSIQQQKLKEFLEIEKLNEIMTKQELEYANASKIQRDKLLLILTEQQTHFDKKLNKIHQIKTTERFKLIELLQQVENNADVAIKELLALNSEPLVQLLEQEKQEEEKLLNAINRYNETLRKDDILDAMRDILAQETLKFKEFHRNRMEISKSILEQEAEIDYKLLEVLQNQDDQKQLLLNKLVIDNDLQKAAVATLLERGDARSWSLLQQIRLVEAQLSTLTRLEIDKKNLYMDQHMNDLCEKRCTLSVLLIDLLEQQQQRRSQLISTLQIMEENNKETIEDFWLRQYQMLLDKLPEGLSHAQKNIDPSLAQALLLNGVIHCLPFLAKLTQCQNTRFISDDDLLKSGVICGNERQKILEAFHIYENEKKLTDSNDKSATATASAPLEEASAPISDNLKAFKSSECVICLDIECEIIFVPCGHLCCCCKCSEPIFECPLCRVNIDRKITLIL